MAQPTTYPGLTTLPLPPILEVLPAVLRREAFPQHCSCEHCVPDWSEAQRAAHQRVEEDWRYARVAWCDAHGYQLAELIRAENQAAQLKVPRRLSA